MNDLFYSASMINRSATATSRLPAEAAQHIAKR